MDDTILGVPKVAVYFVLAIVFPVALIVAGFQTVTFTEINKLAVEQGRTRSAVEQLAVTPTAMVTITPSPTIVIPTQSLIKPTVKQQVKPATRSGQVR